ncbi:MAG: glycosyltransferase [Dehalococcoidia bacterium]|nr:glycosyltransferase [Dehalococcoidia bacterium]
MQEPGTVQRAQGRRAPEWCIRLLGLVTIIAGFAYLVWRAGWTLNMDAWWLSFPLLIAEIHAYVTFVLYCYMTWDLRPLKPAGMRRPASVDIFIPTFDEPPQVLALTIAGAVDVRGPHETWVLDDGRREWVRELCEQWGGVRYLTRPDNAGAKAGNINHALQYSSGEFIIVLDADHVPAPDFIEAALPYFGNEDIALVQGPQEYYNLDSFQHTGDGSDWHEQTTFYHVIQPGKNRRNSAFWCGSPSMVRRSALENVGGVATETITEDLHTSLRLHRAGWRSVYHDEVLARGIAPDDYDGFILQRLRWARGAMQVIRQEFWRGGISLGQRLNYIGSTGTYFDAYRKAIFLSLIPLILFTGQLPIDAPVPLFLVVWASYFVLSQAANVAAGRGYYRWLWIEMFDLLKMPAFLMASLTLLFGGKAKFRVTPKAQAGERRIHPMVMPFAVLIGIYAAALIVGALRLTSLLPAANTGAMVAAMAWGIVIMGVLVVLLRRAYVHVTRRGAHRLRVSYRAWVSHGTRAVPAEFVNVTLKGVAYRAETAPTPGQTVRFFDAYVRGVHGEATVRSVSSSSDGRYLVGVEFTGEDVSRRQLARTLAKSLFAADEAAGREGEGAEPRPIPQAA